MPVIVLRCLAAAGLALLLALPSSALQAQDSATVVYDLGEISITQAARFEPGTRFYDMPVQVRGVLALPAGEGPFPVAVFLHGSYTFCDAPLVNKADVYPCPEEYDLRQFEGFTYLAEALAARGYLALVPDLAAEHTIGWAEPVFGERGVQILNAHLDALAAGDGFGLDVAGKADLSRLVMVSHSRGGPLSIIYAANLAPAPVSAIYPVAALALLTPSGPEVGAVIPETMPTALVIATCDGDVQTQGPLAYAEEQLPPLRPALTVLFTLAYGTHNAFSTQLGPDFFVPDECRGIELLDPQRQRDFTARFVPDFLDMALNSVLLAVTPG
jgi:hypothetical protein